MCACVLPVAGKARPDTLLVLWQLLFKGVTGIARHSPRGVVGTCILITRCINMYLQAALAPKVAPDDGQCRR